MANWINKKAKFNYAVLEEHTCGIVFNALEAKAVYEGRVAFNDSYCYFNGHELFVKNLHISPPKHYQNNYSEDWQPLRERKLLMQKYELKRLKANLVKGLTIVPLEVFVKDKKFIKVRIGLVKGKNQRDKRETIKTRDVARELQQY